MAVQGFYFTPENAVFFTGAGFPQYVRIDGSSYSVSGLSYDGAGTTVQEASWKFDPANYVSGDISIGIRWYAVSGTTGACVFAASFAAITPNTDTQDVQTKGFGSSPTVTDSHLGTTARRLHQANLTMSGSNLDSIAAGDEAWLRVFRSPGAAGDTMTANAIVTSVILSYAI